MFVLNSDITIGKFRFSGVKEVHVKKSLHSLGDSAVIRIPSRCRVMRKDGKTDPGIITTANLFKDEMKDGKPVSIPVIIKLGYNGELRTEFEGFVFRRNAGMPLEIECEGYARQLRLNNNLSGFVKDSSAKELLEMACGIRDVKGKKLAQPKTDITVVCQDDVPMKNIKLIACNGMQIVDEVKKISQGTLAVFFISPKVLWCGFTYTPYVDKKDPFGNGRVKYRLGYNCIKDNGLKERIVTEPVQVIFGTTVASGQVVETASEATYAVKKDKTVFNNVQDRNWMLKMANEKQYKLNYTGYEGHLTGFLNPFAQPGYMATIVDATYPERTGDYMVESTEVRFGTSGARRTVEIGPLIGFDPKNVK